MAAGTFVLAISAMFATKANKKFVSVSTAYFGSSGLFITGIGSGVLTTASSNLKTAFVTLYTSTHHFATKLHEGSATGKTLFHV